jgi:hypothetical protein
MQIDLRNGLHAAIWGRDLIFFDARAGTYQMMAGAAAAAGVDVIGPTLTVEEDSFVTFMREQNMLGEPGGAFETAPPIRPTRSLLTTLPSKGPNHIRAIIEAYGDMATLYVGRPLPFLLAHARLVHTETSGGCSRGGDKVALAQAFERAYPWLPLQGACIFRGFMLMRLLRRAGIRGPRWVFGVRTWPFHAHCWVQDGDMVLTDHAESLLRYTPIFAV